MKASTTLITGLVILAAGIVLIICNDKITQNGVVIAAGILFLLSGIINTVLYIADGQKDGENKTARSGISKFFGIVVSIAAFMLGLSMFIFSTTFESLIPMLFGLILLFGALVQIYIVAVAQRQDAIPLWLFVVPGVLLVLSLIVFMANLSEPRLMTITGSGLVLFGVGGFVESMFLNSARRRERHAAKTEDAGVMEVKAKEIKPHDDKEIRSLDD